MKRYTIIPLIAAVFFLFNPIPARAATICDDFSSGLVSHWRLEESTGTRVDSKSTNDLSPTNTPTNAAGKVGNAVSIARASSQYLSRTEASATSLNPTGDLSINFWYNPTSFTDGNWHGLVSKKDTSDTTPGPFSSAILRDVSTYYFVFGLQDGATARGSLFTINSYVGLGTWHMATLTYNKTTGEKKVYIDNTNVQTETVTVTTYSDQADFRIGWYNIPSAADGWDGLIDEVSIWHGRVITPTEVGTLYNSGSGISYPCAAGAGTGYSYSQFLF